MRAPGAAGFPRGPEEGSSRAAHAGLTQVTTFRPAPRQRDELPPWPRKIGSKLGGDGTGVVQGFAEAGITWRQAERGRG
jgi:hypothetical protein